MMEFKRAALRAVGEQIALWVKRSEDFTAVGDFVSARLMFQRAAETGDARWRPEFGWNSIARSPGI
jgi:hypothetical protein